MKKVNIGSDYIKLDQFLKLADIVMSGGEAKLLIMSEEIKVNGEIATQRGKKLRDRDIVEYMNKEFQVSK
ncbi:RNA-binding S4 domain-containing protein [Peptostreptococcus stomatis]|uniref:RNA-binding S4 domain-containing protein n=1 Tax=Peptostreptococcus stomatis TaxID=341694 RepID=UPI0026F09F18|nr:RNA-binding S4 domain-containing protein [Peptostreptococcus stomatis]